MTNVGMASRCDPLDDFCDVTRLGLLVHPVRLRGSMR